MKSLSIIVPCYNEGEKLLLNISKIKNFIFETFSEEKLDFEIIIVNDGSTDNSKNIFEKFCKEDDYCKLATYDKNRGKGFAVKKGIELSSKDIVVFMDADLSTELTALIDVFKFIDNYDIVVGSRRHPESVLVKKQGKCRRVLGKTCSIITNNLMSFNISDTQCGFKAFKGDTARKIVEKQTIEGFAFDVELLYIASLNSYSIKEIPVIWENDEDSRVRLVRSSLAFIKDLYLIKSKKKDYIK